MKKPMTGKQLLQKQFTDLWMQKYELQAQIRELLAPMWVRQRVTVAAQRKIMKLQKEEDEVNTRLLVIEASAYNSFRLRVPKQPRQRTK